MLRSFIWTILFLIVLAAAAFGLLILLVSGKEGGETWQLVLGALGFWVFAIVWWKLSPRFTGRYEKVLSCLGKGVLSALCIAYTLFTAPYLVSYFQGPWLAKKVSIENYQESPIVWPGFDGPVGLLIEMDLVHPFHKNGVLHPPLIWMGESKKLRLPDAYYSFDRYYFYGGEYMGYVDKIISRLQTVLFTQSAGPVQDLSREYRTRIVYRLLPEAVTYLESPSRLCLKKDSFGLSPERKQPPIYVDGKDLSAVWFFAGPANLTIELSDLLTHVLRTQSSLQNEPERWKEIQQRLEPPALKEAGYTPCKILKDDLDARSGRACFCRTP